MAAIRPASTRTLVTSSRSTQGVAAYVEVHRQDRFVVRDGLAGEVPEDPRIEEVVGHRQDEPVADEIPGLEHGQPVLLFPLVVADGGDRYALGPGQPVQMPFDQIAGIAGDDHKIPDPGQDAGPDDAVDEGAPRDLEEGLALRAAGQTPTPAGRDNQAFHSGFSK